MCFHLHDTEASEPPEMDADNADETPINFRELLRQSTAKTGVQGVNNINDARTLARRTFWAIVVVIGICKF